MNGAPDANAVADADPRARLPLRLVLFGAVALASVFFGFIYPTVDQARELVQRFGYFSIAGTFAWAIVAALRARGDFGPASSWFERGEALRVSLVIAALTLLATLTIPYTYKVLYDEFVLQSTAMHMHQAREVGASVRAYEIEGVFRSIGTYLDKRPFFFAFLVSLVHDVFGYREGNAFALNTALMPVVLLLSYVLARRVAGKSAGLVVVVTLGAFSLMAHNATGAGMEMLNLAMLLAVMLLASWYVERPDERRLSLLLLTTVLFAQTRYESSLYVAPVALVVLEGWRRAGRVLLPAAAIFAPALLVPYALHQTYLSGSPQLWELREGEATRFGVQYLGDNLKHACEFFFSFSGTMPNSWWLALAGFPALVWAAARIVRGARSWRQADPVIVAIVLLGGAVMVNLGLLMFYYWGQLDDPIVARLSLPFSVVLALSAGWAAACAVPERWRHAGVVVAIGGALFSYVSSGLRANATHGDLNMLMREIAWEGDVLESLPQTNRLVISNKSGLFWILRETPSIPLARARWRAPAIQFHLDHHTFNEVIVTQKLLPTSADGGFQVEPRDRLPEEYVLEPIAQRRFETHLTRISRVKEIRITANTPGVQAVGNP